MNFLPILLLTLTTTTLVLRSGDRIAVDGTVREENGRVTFRSEGTLYSLPASEVERIVREQEAIAPAPAPRREEKRVDLAVSDQERRRLIADLERNHSGKPAPPEQTVKPAPPPPTPEEVRELTGEELRWRREARGHEEAIRRAIEELDLLETRARDLQSRIFQLVALGYKPHQFSYDTTVLAHTLEQIPYARLEVTRAERAFEQFREDARRQGVLPGWLR
jgi:hypothetical protein